MVKIMVNMNISWKILFIAILIKFIRPVSLDFIRDEDWENFKVDHEEGFDSALKSIQHSQVEVQKLEAKKMLLDNRLLDPVKICTFSDYLNAMQAALSYKQIEKLNSEEMLEKAVAEWSAIGRSNLPLSGKESIARFGRYLLPWEIEEMKLYDNIWYLGLGVKKSRTNKNARNNFGFSSKGDGEYLHYIIEVGSHISYRYKVTRKLGRGTFGTVVEAYDFKEQRYVAIKLFSLDQIWSQQHFKQEVSMSLFVRNKFPGSEHYSRLIDTMCFRNHYCAIFDLYGRSFSKLELPVSNMQQFAQYVRDIAQSLSELQTANIIHNDVKPSNIVFPPNETDGGLKLIDFGHSCVIPSKEYLCSQYAQSSGYSSPEMLFGLPYDTSSDVFSLGIMMLQMALGRNHFSGDDQPDAVAALMEVKGPIPQFILDETGDIELYNDALKSVTAQGIRRMPSRKPLQWLLEIVPKDLANLITDCLEFHPTKRPTFYDILAHDFLQKNLP